MNIWGFLVIVLGIIIIIAIFQQGGWTGFSTSPIQSSWDATKTIGEKSKDAFDKTKELIEDNSGTSISLKNVGLPLCQDDSDCLSLSECSSGNCICGGDGNCYLNQTG